MSKGRKSLGRRHSRTSLSGFASKDLCETIPKSLESSERLLLLVERCFQYALSVVQKNFMLNENFDVSQFRKEGMDFWEKGKSLIEEQKLCHSAVTESKSSDQSLLTSKAIDVKVMLEAEIDKWNEIKAHYRKDLEKEINNPCIISADWKGKDMLFDYSGVVEHTLSTQQDLKIQINDLEKAKSSVKMGIKRNNESKIIMLKCCEENIKSKRKNSPRTIIRKMGAVSKVKMHHRYS